MDIPLSCMDITARSTSAERANPKPSHNSALFLNAAILRKLLRTSASSPSQLDFTIHFTPTCTMDHKNSQKYINM
jgi:hypothetical protein